MNIEKGLESAIATFSEKEQQYITFVAKKLESHGFPLDNLTRVDLQKTIKNVNEYYAYNEVTFYSNPAVYRKGEPYSASENVGLNWDSPTTVYNEDGSVEFQFAQKVNVEDLIPVFYRLNDSYSTVAAHKNYDDIVEKIDKVFLEFKEEPVKTREERLLELKKGQSESSRLRTKLSRGQSIASFTSQGIYELLYNYEISIVEDTQNTDLYELFISGLDYKRSDLEHYNELRDNCQLKIDVKHSTIEVLNCYDPTFFPTPAVSRPIKFPDTQ
ncbi:hypothetical protein [Psychromonas algicola]|uniref:hypothetical protein n=1 Tax=Psychromonas algicola TaxID=2555642 RepID=UPI001067EACE|nr:hypothetical protein [Psychromonas sp. RZ5]TEW49831.1 hypothetical protein E2R67_10185 [Psychromonas sp. RZ5]